MARLLSLSLALSFLLCSAARADGGGRGTADSTSILTPSADTSRPTSGTLSVISGRTNGIGRTTWAFGAGWPGAYAELHLALSSTFDLAFRGTFLWGSSMMGVPTGWGGDFMVPVRWHIWGQGTTDVALTARLAGMVGEARLGGEVVPFDQQFGWGTHLDAGGLIGLQLSDTFTLTLGILVGGGAVDTPSNGRFDAVGLLYAVLGIEAAISEDTLLFAEFEGGFGLVTDQRFTDGHELLRATLGIAFAP